MTAVNEQLYKFADMQRQAFEPARAFGGFAIDTFEKFMRANIAVMDVCLDYARSQAEMAGQAQNVTDYVGQQVEQGRNFVEQMAQHAQQYVTLAGTTAREAAEVTQTEINKIAKGQE